MLPFFVVPNGNIMQKLWSEPDQSVELHKIAGWPVMIVMVNGVHLFQSCYLLIKFSFWDYQVSYLLLFV